MPLSAPEQHRQRVAALGRHRPNSPELDEARRALRLAKLEQAIRREVDAAPPLTLDQRIHLALLLGGGAADAKP